MKSDRAAPASQEPVLFSATVAPMHAEPRIARPMVSQQVSGHAVEVLEREGEWLRASGSDGYQGWMHQGFLMRVEAPPAAGALRISLGCVVSRPGQGRRALPLLAWLSQDDVVQSDAQVVPVGPDEGQPLAPLLKRPGRVGRRRTCAPFSG